MAKSGDAGTSRASEVQVCNRCLEAPASPRTPFCNDCRQWARYWDKYRERWKAYAHRVQKAARRIGAGELELTLFKPPRKTKYRR